MKKHLYISHLCCIAIALVCISTGCKEKYVPELNVPVTGYLVVEGFINSGTGPTTITLARTTKVSDTAFVIKELKASVRVEAKNSAASFLLTEKTPGIYTYPQLTLDPTDQYRLRITTSNSRQYVSDYSAVRRTPDIDSIAWREEKGGLQLYANTHDPNNKTTYYRYQYDETWEFHSTYGSYLDVVVINGENHHLKYKDPLKGQLIDSSIYKCWQSFSSYSITLTSTEKLDQDIVSMFPFNFIEPHSWKLSVLYSINLKQYALSREAFRFYEQLKKNTQQLGTIFDAQPSDNNGNMHPLNNSGEPVVGFIEVSEEKQKRIFIDNSQLNKWSYIPDCTYGPVHNTPDCLEFILNTTGLPFAELPPPLGFLYGAYWSRNYCVDCTFLGVNKKPVYWPW